MSDPQKTAKTAAKKPAPAKADADPASTAKGDVPKEPEEHKEPAIREPVEAAPAPIAEPSEQEEPTMQEPIEMPEPTGAEPLDSEMGFDKIEHSAVNAQILSSLQSASEAVMGGHSALVEAQAQTALGQSLSMALQDAAEHLRRTEIMAESATALGLKRIADGKENGAEIITAATNAVDAAAKRFVELGESVSKLRSNLDRSNYN